MFRRYLKPKNQKQTKQIKKPKTKQNKFFKAPPSGEATYRTAQNRVGNNEERTFTLSNIENDVDGGEGFEKFKSTNKKE